MNYLHIMCYLMSFVLTVISFYSNIMGRLFVDVFEADGRLVIWKESEYMDTDNLILFRSRDKNINSVYISYDDGKSYSLLCDNINDDEFSMAKGDVFNHICIRFISNNYLISRQFKINFLDNAFTGT